MVKPVVLAERDIESVRTQVIIQTFSDRVLVLVTQLQKVGTLVRKLCSNCSTFISHSLDPSFRAIYHRPHRSLFRRRLRIRCY